MLTRRKTYSMLALFISLFCTNYALGWQWGDDITVQGFTWDDIRIVYQGFPYVDDADGNKVKYCYTKKVFVFNNLEASHVSTTTNVKLPHYHFKDDWGNGTMATSSQADAYYNARFYCPIITYLTEDTTSNVDNCFSYASRYSFLGTYNYAFDDYLLSVYTVVNTDAYVVSPKSNVNILGYASISQ